ncbi:putative multidrug resistance ABC transporter ATP-binding/permease protein YheH [compost metagenome]
MKGKTCVFIAHRVSTIKNADKIIVLDQGRIAEEGSHEELMNLKGQYFELHEKQLLEAI